MSQSDVRNALAEYFEGQKFDNVVGIFKGLPLFFPGFNWQPSIQQPWQTLLAINIDHFSETRITLPAQTPDRVGGIGQKERLYTVSVLLNIMYQIPQSYSYGQDAATYEDGVDEIVEAVVASIHADPTLGTGGSPIFEAGQTPQGLSVDIDTPKQSPEGAVAFCWARIYFDLSEIITA